MDWDRFIQIYHETLFTIGNTKVTLQTILGFVTMIVLVLVVAHLSRKALRDKILSRTRLEIGQQYAIARITGYIIVVLGILIGLTIIGVDMTSLAVLAGAFGVGIGFGLQDIVNNFVSGLIILFERVIQIDDRIQLDDTLGKVVRIGARSASVLTNDNIMIIVPNSEFVSKRVVNLSYAGDLDVRIRMPIGVGYGSDPRQVEKLLLEVAAANEHVLAKPAPTVIFLDYGASSLDFELRIWTRKMTHTPMILKSQIYFAAWEKLKAHGVEIPFPQRDLHFKEPLKVQVDEELRGRKSRNPQGDD